MRLPVGLCAGDIELFCGKVKPGEQRISKCLTDQALEEEKGNVQGEPQPTGLPWRLEAACHEP